ncbi:MAG: flagellar FlbD family protein [Frankiales bacterium]|nr:flagellar FlbD family protein [Frankiales bacterium]
MIRLTRLNGSEMFLNADLVATVESHHDTVVTLVDGKTYVVLESAETVVAEVAAYRASVLAAAELHLVPLDAPSDDGGRLLHLRPATDGGC